MTKKQRVKSLILSFPVLLCCACTAVIDSVPIVNAKDAQGLIYDTTTVTPHPETELPMVENTSDNTDISSSVETTASTVSDSSEINTTSSGKISITSNSKTETKKQETTTATTKTNTTTSTAATTTAATTTTTTTTSATTTTTTEPPQTTPSQPSNYTALNYDKVVGVWISYIELNPILNGKSEAQFRSGFRQMMQNCKDFGINTVYVHLRAFGDAFYKSDYYPWSKYVTGKLGTAPSFDPLKIMLEEAHSLGISFHGWINPMRIQSNADISSVSGNYRIGKWYGENSDYVLKSGDYWYLNPAYDDVIGLIANGASEIVRNYNVDGLHIDDYFYPTTSDSYDKKAFSASGYSSLTDFRYNNCNKLVKSLYNAVKSANSSALFGVSPQGSIENNLNVVYADVREWCSKAGYCDYIAPQVYYGFENSAQPYKECLQRWQNMVSGTSVKLISGLAVYKIGKEDTWAGSGKNEWINNSDILKRQIYFSKTLASYGGYIFYSYNYMFNSEYLTAAINTELSALK